MNVGDMVVVNRCDQCPDIVGKTAKIRECFSGPDGDTVGLNFGKGRPAINRPELLSVDDVSLVNAKE